MEDSLAAIGVVAHVAAATLLAFEFEGVNAPWLVGARDYLRGVELISGKLRLPKDRNAGLRAQRIRWGREWQAREGGKRPLESFLSYLRVEWFSEEDLQQAWRAGRKAPKAELLSSTMEGPDFSLELREDANLLLSLPEEIVPAPLLLSLLSSTKFPVTVVRDYSLETEDVLTLVKRWSVLGASIVDLYATIVVAELYTVAGDINQQRNRLFHPDILLERLTEAGVSELLTPETLGLETRRVFLALVGLYYLRSKGDLAAVNTFLERWLQPTDTEPVRVYRNLLEGRERKLSEKVLQRLGKQTLPYWCAYLKQVLEGEEDSFAALRRYYARDTGYSLKEEVVVYPSHIEVWGRGLDIERGVSFAKVGRGVTEEAAKRDLVEQIVEESCSGVAVPIGTLRSRRLILPKEAPSSQPGIKHKEDLAPAERAERETQEDSVLLSKFRTGEKALCPGSSQRVASRRPRLTALTAECSDLHDLTTLRQVLHLDTLDWAPITDTELEGIFLHDVGDFTRLELEGDLLLDRVLVRLIGVESFRRYRDAAARNSTLFCLFSRLNLCCRVRTGEEIVRVKHCADAFEALLGLLGRYAGADLSLLLDYVSRWWFTPSVIERLLRGERIDDCRIRGQDVREAGLGAPLPCP